MPLLKEIKFLSWDLSFVEMSILSHVHFLGLSLEVSIQSFFFSILFSIFSNCRFPLCSSVISIVICITDCCNQSLFSFLNIFFECLKCYIHANPNIGESSPSFFFLGTNSLCYPSGCCIVGSMAVFHRYKPKSWQVYRRAVNAFHPEVVRHRLFISLPVSH